MHCCHFRGEVLTFEHCREILHVGDWIADTSSHVSQAAKVSTRSFAPSMQPGSMLSGKDQLPLQGRIMQRASISMNTFWIIWSFSVMRH